MKKTAGRRPSKGKVGKSGIPSVSISGMDTLGMTPFESKLVKGKAKNSVKKK